MTAVSPLTDLPDLLALAEADPLFFPALLASEAANPDTGRYSILFAALEQSLEARDPHEVQALLRQVGQSTENSTLAGAAENELPFSHGWFFYLAYEAVAGWENRLAQMPLPSQQPLALALRCGGAVVIDHQSNRSWITARDESTLASIKNRMLAARDFGQTQRSVFTIHEEPARRFEKNVQRVREYIAAGDVYQVNLARQWRLQASELPSPAQLYRQLAWSNPAPFAGLLQWGSFAVISSSPERLVKKHGQRIETRPIAGTRPRSPDATADKRLMAELIAHPKERAEHIMLLDLERNDLGRICIPGSVCVDELMTIESYPHVHHIVSNVTGKLRANIDFAEIVQAVFPGGTITGCPKIRCMEIIAELEQRPRGAYTGSMGYVNHNGNMDSNILIRTMVRQGHELSFMAGAGIVMDSEPRREVAETGHKAEGMLRAVKSGARAENPADRP